MGLFNRLFGSNKNKSVDQEIDKGDNRKLLKLIQQFSDFKDTTNYEAVLTELEGTEPYLYLASLPTEEESDDALQLTCVFQENGQNVLLAFTSLEGLKKWRVETETYTILKAKNVLAMAASNEMDRIVIDFERPSMFVLERNPVQTVQEIIHEGNSIQVGPPTTLLSENLVRIFKYHFGKVEAIKRVFYFTMRKENTQSLILGFELHSYEKDNVQACFDAVHNIMEGVTFDLPLDLFMLEESNWLETVSVIENAFLYEKE